jgi:hypothetical protein
MKAGELLNLISEETVQFFATESNVNNQVKKLDGIVMFKLILFSMLNSEKASLRVMESLSIENMPINATVKIEADELVFLKARNLWEPNQLRLIRAKLITTNKPIFFVTNIFDMNAYEVATIYKQRWQIENIFKLLKQQLNLCLVTRNQNGIKVMIYMTLILAILMLAYKN